MKVRTLKSYPSIYFLDKEGKVIKRKCGHCGIIKDIGEFNRTKSRKYHIHPTCKPCRKILGKKRWIKYSQVSTRNIGIKRLKAFEIIANGKEIKCVATNFWGCCRDSLNALYLSIDHIENDGYIHKKELNTTSSSTLYNWVIKNPEEARKRLQIMCMNAQTMKKRIFSKEKRIFYFNVEGTEVQSE